MKLDVNFLTKQRKSFITLWVNTKVINMKKRSKSRNRKVIYRLTRAEIEAFEREYYDKLNSELSFWVGEMY